MAIKLTESAIREEYIRSHPSLGISIRDINEMSNYDLIKHLQMLDNTNTFDEVSRNYYEAMIRKKLSKSENIMKWEYAYCPFFTPLEIQEFKGYYSDREPDEDIKLLQKSYFNSYNSFGAEFLATKWYTSVNALQNCVNYWCFDDEDKTNEFRQDLVDIGWNPEIEFTPENQIKAKQRIEFILNNQYGERINYADVSQEYNSDETNTYLNESDNPLIHPISIILVKGDSAFSNAISGVTKSEFSHSAICLNNEYNKLYSYNLLNNVNITGGFSLESIRNYPKDNRLAVFTFFIDNDTFEKISGMIQDALLNIKNTRYSIANILLYPFKHINFNASDMMICSQFVDCIMKMANFDITGRDSSKVTPALLYNSSIKSTKIFKIFDGMVKDFDEKKAERLVNRISNTKKARLIKEDASIMEVASFYLESMMAPIITEARKFPIEVTDDGDLLLTNPMIDFDQEYSACHKLMIQYEKSNNIEGMKYELARLHYMNYVIEKRLYHNDQLKNKEKNIKTRARVLNDYKKYMKWVLVRDPKFNFSEYYENSPFYNNSILVKRSTLKTAKDIFKHILYM